MTWKNQQKLITTKQVSQLTSLTQLNLLSPYNTRETWCFESIFGENRWFSMVQDRLYIFLKILNFDDVWLLRRKMLKQKLFVYVVSLMGHCLTAEMWFKWQSECPILHMYYCREKSKVGKLYRIRNSSFVLVFLLTRDVKKYWY